MTNVRLLVVFVALAVGTAAGHPKDRLDAEIAISELQLELKTLRKRVGELESSQSIELIAPTRSGLDKRVAHLESAFEVHETYQQREDLDVAQRLQRLENQMRSRQ